MLFCSGQFALFFLFVFSVYWLLPRLQWRVYWLLGASFFFYASWSKWLAALIFFSTFLDYCLALGMERVPLRWRRVLLIVSLTANLGLLAYFKYVNFFLQSLEEALHAVGGTAHLPLLKVILPIGISFYTFEAINYMVDVYRGHVRAERNLGHFMLFITFFPHLIAGPIVRARDFLPQIRREKRWDWLRIQLGMQFFLIGLIKKLLIADRMAIYADPIFANPQQYSSLAVWTGVIAYAIQIYGDFSGYTDMALGTAHMLGYKLAQNFNMPYLAVNIADFWRRWHISLSSWLRDYLFIPLGGSRGSTWATCRNLMITMTLGGLWHGAAWTFILWGVLHGVFLVVHRGFQALCERVPWLARLLQTPPGTACRIALTFLCVCVGWVFFRATTYAGAMEILWRMRKLRPGLEAPLPYDSLIALAAVVVLSHFVAQSGAMASARGSLARAGVGLLLRRLLHPGDGAGARDGRRFHLLPVLRPDMATRQKRILRGRTAVLWAVGAFVSLQLAYHYPIRHWLPQVHDVEYANKLRDLKAHAANRSSDQPLVVAFGSSLTAMALKPTDMLGCQPTNPQGPIVFNHSINGGSVMVQLLCFRRMLAEGIRPDCVIFETHPLFFLSEGKDNPRRKTRDWPATRVDASDLTAIERYYWHARQFRNEWASLQIVPWYAHRHVLQNWLLPSWVPEKKRTSHLWSHTDTWGWEVWPEYLERCRKAYRDNPAAWETVKKNVEGWNHQVINDIVNQTLHEALEMCRREKIRVVLVWVPESSHFRDHYSAALNQRIDDWLHQVQERSDAQVVNARAWLVDDDFCDGWHVNPVGAANFSRRLESEILLPFLRNDSATRSASR